MARPMAERTILAVEDDASLLEIYQAVATMAGIQRFWGVRSGDEGLALALQLRPDFLLIDLTLPGMDGMALLEVLRRDPHASAIHPIVISGAHEIDKLEHTLRGIGVKDVLGKPFDLARLLSILQHHPRAAEEPLFVGYYDENPVATGRRQDPVAPKHGSKRSIQP